MSEFGTTRKKTAVVMTSALLYTPDVAREAAYFAFVPIGDIALMLDHLVSARDVAPIAAATLALMAISKCAGCSKGVSAG